MSRVKASICSIWVCLFVACCIYGKGEANPPLGDVRNWTVYDAVSVRQFLRASEGIGGWGSDGGRGEATVSPDGKYCFTLSNRAALRTDENVTELRVYSLDALEAARTSGKKTTDSDVWCSATYTTRSYSKQAICEPRWGDDSRAILFRKPNPSGKWQVVALDVLSREFTMLTDERFDVFTFDYSKGTLVFRCSANSPQWRDYGIGKYPFSTLRRGEAIWLTVHSKPQEIQVWVSARGRDAIRIPGTDAGEPVWFSPDGTKVIVLMSPYDNEVPPEWRGYDGTSDDGFGGRQKLIGSEFPVFMMFDAQSAKCSSLFSAPAGIATSAGEVEQGIPEAGSIRGAYRPLLMPHRAFWSKDSNKVVLVNTALPLEGDDQTVSERRTMAYIALYDVASGALTTVLPLVDNTGVSVTSAQWRIPGDELRFERIDVNGDKMPATDFRLSTNLVGSGKSAAAVASTLSDLSRSTIEVTIDESEDQPPMVVARDRQGWSKVLDVSEDYSHVGLVTPRRMEWKTEQGVSVTGDLYTPSIAPGPVRLPLVILLRTSEIRRTSGRFRPDGYQPSTGIQSLVARGLAVLHLQVPPAIARQRFAISAFIDDVVDELQRKGWLIPTKVGIDGFSRLGALVYSAITHPGRTPLAGAIIRDSSPGTLQHLLISKGYNVQNVERIARDFGGLFWTNRATWLMEDPTFNLDRCKTPTLFSVHNQSYAETIAPATIGAFRLAQRPFDYVMFKEAGHQLTRPRQRLAEMELSVDWMQFWLQDREDPDPAKSQQYQYWREVRAAWEKTQREEAMRPATTSAEKSNDQ